LGEAHLRRILKSYADLQLRQNAPILEQGCADFSPGSANRCDQFTRHPGRTSSPLRQRLSCRYTQLFDNIAAGAAIGLRLLDLGPAHLCRTLCGRVVLGTRFQNLRLQRGDRVSDVSR
jgi:hypothetical protein